ncbi:DNA recombination protein RmuC [Candidatus Saccharibacteria bacterium]|nr:DNA recombination protein RmuC [Candidatus Saccharibacteria bacterium]
MTIAVIILAILVVALGVALIFGQRKDSGDQYLQHDLTELRRDMVNLSNNLTKTVDDKLGKNQQSVQTQLKESAKIVADVSNRLTKLDETNKHVADVASDLKTLQNVLQNPKQRGVFGEYQLESVLGNVLPVGVYQMQYRFKNGEAVDAAVFLDKGKILPIDSKFSLENYNRMVESNSKTERTRLQQEVKKDLKNRIDETAKYIRPGENTMDIAFMFIPSESLYYDVIINNVGEGGSSRNLIDYAFRDKKVIIVSPTTLIAYLQTVLQGLRSLQIEEQAKDIQKRVAQLGTHINKFDEFMHKLGASLGTTVNHFNSAHKELSKVDKDVIKIAGGDESIDPLLIDKPSLE